MHTTALMISCCHLNRWSLKRRYHAQFWTNCPIPFWAAAVCR